MQITKAFPVFGFNRFFTPRFVISLLWCAGLLTGRLIATHNPWTYSSLDVFSNAEPVLAGGILTLVSPLLLGAILCLLNHRLLYALIYSKAITYAIVSTNIMIAFKSAGWLLRILLLSADTVFVFVLLIFALCSIGRPFSIIKRNAAISIIASAFFIWVDLSLIEPYISSLLLS